MSFIAFREKKFSRRFPNLPYLLVVMDMAVVSLREIKSIGQHMEWRSQNSEKVTHIKGRLLEQVVILFNRAPFQNGNFS